MYRDAGWDVTIRTPSPSAIARASYDERDDISRRFVIPRLAAPQSPSIEGLARELLREMIVGGVRRRPAFVFHAFSNGGCYLWERFWPLLKTGTCSSSSSLVHKDNDNITKEEANATKDKLIGVIFDSSPAMFHSDDIDILRFLAEYGAFDERTSHELLTTDPTTTKATNGTTSPLRDWLPPLSPDRGVAYWNGMRNDDSDTPQLYIYSRDDDLTSFEPLDELVRHRKETVGDDRVWSLRFSKSRHCGHLLVHPEEYRGTVERFLEYCRRRGGDEKGSVGRCKL